MTETQQPALRVFGLGMIGLGLLALAVGDFAMQWQPVAPWFPGRTVLAYASGVLMVGCGAGLLFPRAVATSLRILFPYCLVWLLLKVPALVVAPTMEAVWLGAGEIAVLFAGAWTLFACAGMVPSSSPFSPLAGLRGAAAARMLFAVAVIPIGLSHFFYPQPTHDLVPAWLPFRSIWGYVTGAGQIASGLGVLFGILPRIAAWAEACQITLFTLLIWLPATVRNPGTRLNWTAFWISWAVAAGALAVAQNIPARVREAQKTRAVETEAG